MRDKKYKPLNLPVELVEELKVWRDAYCRSRNENVTFEKMIEDMIACNRNGGETTNEISSRSIKQSSCQRRKASTYLMQKK